MSTLTRIKPSAYHDSVTLMLVAQAVLKLPGVQDAAVVMGTAANREIIAAAGLLTPEAAGARPDDLLIVIKARTRLPPWPRWRRPKRSSPPRRPALKPARRSGPSRWHRPSLGHRTPTWR